uniref:Uncharacterized protein n=1 Tax=Mustela putorius furo TaxID=9669 RepID=M3Y4S3_MUSPF
GRRPRSYDKVPSFISPRRSLQGHFQLGSILAGACETPSGLGHRARRSAPSPIPVGGASVRPHLPLFRSPLTLRPRRLSRPSSSREGCLSPLQASLRDQGRSASSGGSGAGAEAGRRARAALGLGLTRLLSGTSPALKGSPRVQGRGVEIRHWTRRWEGPAGGSLPRARRRTRATGAVAGRARRAVGGGLHGGHRSQSPFHEGSGPTGGVDAETGESDTRLRGKQSSGS